MNPIYRTLRVGDAKFNDAAGAFLTGELERLDPVIHEPLMDFTYHRDIPIRTDVSLGDEYTSFANVDYGMTGSTNGSNINWVEKESTVVAIPNIDLAKTRNPFRGVEYACKYTYLELESSMTLGRPIDQMQIKAVQMKHQRDADTMAYIGDTAIAETGLVNNASVTVSNAPNGAGLSPYWANKTPDEILQDINDLITSVWNASGNAIAPSKVLVPTKAMSALLKPMTSTGISVLNYVQQNCIYRAISGNELQIAPVKYLDAAGTSGVGRMIAYTPDENLVRFPMTPLKRYPLHYIGNAILFYYVGRLGAVEFVKPETVGYMDGITAA